MHVSLFSTVWNPTKAVKVVRTTNMMRSSPSRSFFDFATRASAGIWYSLTRFRLEFSLAPIRVLLSSH